MLKCSCSAQALSLQTNEPTWMQDAKAILTTCNMYVHACLVRLDTLCTIKQAEFYCGFVFIVQGEGLLMLD